MRCAPTCGEHDPALISEILDFVGLPSDAELVVTVFKGSLVACNLSSKSTQGCFGNAGVACLRSVKDDKCCIRACTTCREQSAAELLGRASRLQSES